MTGDPAAAGFWAALDELVASCRIVIDRPRGTSHPRYPELIYPLSYGYLDGTHAIDAGGIDVWRGSSSSTNVDAVLCTVDLAKRDAEIKVLIGCSDEDRRSILDFSNRGSMRALLVERRASA
jgi:inorganic pyrophosphatase